MPHHDTKGRPVFSSGRLRYGRVPYDVFPDSPPVRCQGTMRSGAPCKNWAVITKTLCRWHQGWQSSSDATTLPRPRVPDQLQAWWTSASLG